MTNDTIPAPFVKIEEKKDLRIIYYREDGSIYIGGNRNWRNNNPGNIGYGNGKLVTKLGAIGKAGGFAVFPDYETRRRAIFNPPLRYFFLVLKTIDVEIPKYLRI